MLKDLLSEVSDLPNLRVLLAKDAEGNEFSELDGFSVEYVDESYTGGRTEDIFSEDDLREDSENGEIPDNFTPVLVLWPV